MFPSFPPNPSLITVSSFGSLPESLPSVKAMANIEANGCNGDLKSGVEYCNGGHGQVGNLDVEDGKRLEDNHIEDVDLLVEDMTDDFYSVVEGMNDRLTISRMVSNSIMKGMVSAITQEAAEVVATKELEVAGLKEVLCDKQFGNNRFDTSVSTKKHGEERESLCILQQVAKEQVQKLGAFIMNVEGSAKSDMANTFYSLKTTVETLCHQIEDTHGQETHDTRQSDIDNALAFIERCKEISCIRHELDSIYKNLVSSEGGHHNLQGSLDANIFHRNISNHENGVVESKMTMPEKFEISKLSHMKVQELYQFFRSEITKIKRDHESDVHQMTEEYFRLKRERPTALFRKDKDCELFRKKLSVVISKLDDILKENVKLSDFCNHSMESLNSLLAENCHLREVLNKEKLETYHLSLQVSNATEKLSRHSLAEEKFQKMIDSLNSSLENARIEASMSEEFYKCILKEMSAQVKSDNEDLCYRSLIMHDIIRTIYEEAFHAAGVELESSYGEITDLESTVTQQIYGTVVQEILMEVSTEVKQLQETCRKGDENLALLETKVAKIENELHGKVEENERLKQETLELDKLLEDKDRSLCEVTEELQRLMDLRRKQEVLIAERDEELSLLKGKLEESQMHIELYMIEVNKLNEALALSESRLRGFDEEKTMLVSALEQQQINQALLKANDNAHKKQMESLCSVIQGFSKSIADLERRTNENIGWYSYRLENSVSQLHSLVPKANILRRTSLLYKERLEKRCSDLQKAEAEVDVLGDEVDALTVLLEKIYVALDHYSPVLQHYPGIIEILKLIRREVSGEAVKVV